MKIAILTGGGDAPGLNPVIRSVVKVAKENQVEMIGIKKGWAGLVELNHFPLEWEDVKNLHSEGGTFLLSSRTNPIKMENGIKTVAENLKQIADGLIAMGGEDTLGVANELYKNGVNVIGVPKTIDNDLFSTDYTIGFDTAINTTVEAIDRIRTTGRSHERFMVVEVMGRHAGWLAVHSGLASGADVILYPEEKYNSQEVCNKIKKLKEQGQKTGIIVIAEGAKEIEGSYTTQNEELDAFGHVKLGGAGEKLAKLIENNTGIETRHIVLGHLARGGTPSAFDRVYGARLGYGAIKLVLEKKWGQMLTLRGTEIKSMSLKDGVKELKTVTNDYKDLIKQLT
tara:strand:+ start:1878 stop:2897 length:1020 start_codon:yes stop_codon:yes gene_type:complete